jgi:tripartite-type tricarboxylate transporter receptor subunit TctC
MKRRDIVGAIGLVLSAPTAFSQTWPSKPIKIISPFAAGGGSDFVARYLSAKMASSFGQPIVVENKAGAGGMLGTDFVAKAPSDGHTLLVSSNGPLALAPALQPKLPYDPQKDFQPIALLTRHPFLIVAANNLGAHDLKSFIELAKKKPGKFNYGTPGTGSANHLAIEMLKQLAEIDIAHVPYKAGPLALTDLLGGVIELVVTDVNSAMPMIKQGKIRALAVTTAKRSPLLPDVPTVAESGVRGYEVPGWFGLLAPAGTPKSVIDSLQAEVAKVMAAPEAREALGGLGGELLASSPTQFSEHIQKENSRWRDLIVKLNIKAEN